MDIDRIISNSLAKIDQDYGYNPRFQKKSGSENECWKPHIMLREYSGILLENYHEELKKSLSAQGIHI